MAHIGWKRSLYEWDNTENIERMRGKRYLANIFMKYEADVFDKHLSKVLFQNIVSSPSTLYSGGIQKRVLSRAIYKRKWRHRTISEAQMLYGTKRALSWDQVPQMKWKFKDNKQLNVRTSFSLHIIMKKIKLLYLLLYTPNGTNKFSGRACMMKANVEGMFRLTAQDAAFFGSASFVSSYIDFLLVYLFLWCSHICLSWMCTDLRSRIMTSYDPW